MSAALPARVDIARQVQAQFTYKGSLPLASMRRLLGSLASSEGEVRYKVAFGKDDFGISWLELIVEAGLPLVCQRTLETFMYPVSIDQRLGLIADEADETGLPEGYEPLLVPDGHLAIADVIEDELILALPVVPMKPGAPLDWNDGSDEASADIEPVNPFGVLGSLKKH
ncbi:MAG: YceD family protein [Dokdonella sp.]